MRNRLKSGCFAAVLAMAAPAVALDGPSGIEPILDTRLRYESVSQDGLAERSQALTFRARFGFRTAEARGLRLLVEGEGVAHLAGTFNDVVNNRPGYPVIADPEVFQLNRAQLEFTGLAGATVIAGRQRVIFGDARFIGNVGFRQNEQTFDGVRVTYAGVENLTLDYAWLARAHRVFGDRHPQGEFDLNAHAATARYALPFGAVTAYGYWLEFRDAPALSSATHGLRLDGGADVAEGWRLNWLAEYARQRDHANSPAGFGLYYTRFEAGIAHAGVTVTLGQERLGGDGARGFSTPLATLHGFQGWADVFLATPANGVRDTHARAAWRWASPPVGRSLQAVVVHHRFDAARGGGRYGNETGAMLALALDARTTLELKAARFNGAAGGPASRDKLWLSLGWRL